MFNILIIIFSYLIGSIPFSVILVKTIHKQDIINNGSGNAGALNSYEISGSKLTGTMVMLLDALKGSIIVLLYHFFFRDNLNVLLLGSIWVVIGHNLSIFLKFKGGRGLATAAGIFILINPYLLIMWLFVWLASYFMIRKNVHIANSIALIGASVMAFSTPNEMLAIFDILKIGNYLIIKILFSIISVIILVKHIKPLRELFSKDI